MSTPEPDLSGTILVADDEESIRWVLERACAQSGHSVVTVPSGAEALSRPALTPLRSRPGRHPHAGCVRARRPLPGARGGPRHALHRDDGAEHDGQRHRGDEARGVRLSHQALRPRAGRRAHRPGPVAAPADQGPRAPARRAQAAARAGHRAHAGDAGGLQDDRSRRADRRHRPHPGRDRHRQGAGREHHPLSLRSPRPVRRHQLLRHPERAARERALRLRARRLHRRRGTAHRQVRGRRGRHALPRRDRRHAARPPVEGAARPAGARVHARRRPGADPRRRPHRRRHQPGPRVRRARRAAFARTSSSG